jgi:hypothetical protein
MRMNYNFHRKKGNLNLKMYPQFIDTIQKNEAFTVPVAYTKELTHFIHFN